MKVNSKVVEIIEKASYSVQLTKEDCIFLLSFDSNSPEAYLSRAEAVSMVRTKSDNCAVIFGQVGIEAHPCAADCSFCAFGISHTSFETMRIDKETIEEKINDFCRNGDLFGLYMMTMHDYDLDFFLDIVHTARKIAPKATKLFSNVGDTDYEAFVEMKEAGIDGVYHVCRLGEGTYTKLDPKQRIATMENAKRAGLELLDCLEPIGPEHTANELVDHIFQTIEMGCMQSGAMKRVAVPGTPFEKYGHITNFRLSHIVAVQALAMLSMKRLPWIGVHEPSEMGYLSGGNLICAETGANPRDTAKDTSASRGLDMDACRRILFESGFSHLRCGDDSKVELTMDYINKCTQR